MSKELVISATPHETRVAIVEDGQLCEIYIEREKEFALVGSLYKGRVTRVLPGMQSAFVDIGLDSDAFLYVSDFLEHLEDYDHVAAPVENKFQKRPQPPPQPGNEVFAPSTTDGGVAHEPVVDAAPPVTSGADEGSGFTQNASNEASSPSDQIPAGSTFTPNASNEAWNPPEKAAAAAPAETTQSVTANAAPPSAPPVQHTQKPYEQRPDRGRGGFNDRGGRGGRNRRWGRQGGGRDRRPGRDLPPSKYASPKPFDSRPRESQPYEPPPADYQPIILPGESLAKYKDRIPAAPAPTAPPAEVVASAPTLPVEPRVTSTDAVTDSGHEQPPLKSSLGLPDALYASSSARESVVEAREGSRSAAPAPAEEFLSAAPITYPQQTSEPETVHLVHEREHEVEPELEIAETVEGLAHGGTHLSDDEVS
jgi:hypothetical protein